MILGMHMDNQVGSKPGSLQGSHKGGSQKGRRMGSGPKEGCIEGRKNGGLVRFALLWLLALLFYAPTRADEAQKANPPAQVSISSQADRTDITIGDRFHYWIQVTYPKDGRINLPSVLGNLGSFEVKDYSESSPKVDGESKIQTWNFTLSTFTVGDYMIPPQVVEYRQGQDTTAQLLMTQPIAIKVKRTSPETVKDIADIAGPESPAVRRPWWLWIAAVLILTALFLLWRLRKSQPKTVKGTAPLKPAFDEAMEALIQLNAIQAVRQNKSRELCFSLSFILRRYVSRRFGVDALESTSDEFIRLVADLPLEYAQKPFVPRFCETTDPVKFAHMPLLESDAGQLVDDMRRFIEATKPSPEGESADKEKPGKVAPSDKPGTKS